MSDIQLTICSIEQLLSATPGDSDLGGTGYVLQVLSLKKVVFSHGAQPAPDIFRLIVSDGVHYTQAALATQLTGMVHAGEILRYSVVRLEKFAVYVLQDKRLVKLLALTPVGNPEGEIGEPTVLHAVPGQNATSSTDTQATASRVFKDEYDEHQSVTSSTDAQASPSVAQYPIFEDEYDDEPQNQPSQVNRQPKRWWSSRKWLRSVELADQKISVQIGDDIKIFRYKIVNNKIILDGKTLSEVFYSICLRRGPNNRNEFFKDDPDMESVSYVSQTCVCRGCNESVSTVLTYTWLKHRVKCPLLQKHRALDPDPQDKHKRGLKRKRVDNKCKRGMKRNRT